MPRAGTAILSILLMLSTAVTVAGAGAPVMEDPPADWTPVSPIPDPLGLAGMYAGTSGDALLAAGGANFPHGMPWDGGIKAWSDQVFALSVLDGKWQAVGRLPRPMGYGASVSWNDALICIGGSDSKRAYADVIAIRLHGDAIATEKLPSLPVPLTQQCAALVGSTIYVVGGIESPDATVAGSGFYALDLSTPPVARHWQSLPTWPGPGRMQAVSASRDGAFYLFSGIRMTAGPDGKPQRITPYLRDAYRYRPGQGWQRLADLPRGCAAAPFPAMNIGPAHLLVAGGVDHLPVGAPATLPPFRSDQLLYHTITNTWVSVDAHPGYPGRVTAPATWWKDRYIIVSGEFSPGRRAPAVTAAQAAYHKSEFGFINYTTLGLYLLAMVALGSWFARRNTSTDAFFRGGQRIPGWAAGISIFATMLSSITFMAIPAQSYLNGWGYFLQNSYLVLTPIVIAVYLPYYRRLNITSAYEFLEQRFNLATRLFGSLLFMLYQAGRIAVVLYLPALALATVSNLDIHLCIVAMGVMCALYTVLGGIEAVIWTDVAQAVILLGGAILALILISTRVDGGFMGIWRSAHASGRFFENVPWNWDLARDTGWVILIGSIFNNLMPYTASQDVVQRYVTTPDQRSAGRAIWINAAISLPASALFFAIGTALFVYYKSHPQQLAPDLPNDGIFPLFLFRQMPAGVAGLVVAGIFAAAQSTLSSSLSSISTAYVTDFHRRLLPATSDAAALRAARWAIVIVGAAGTGAALLLAGFNIRSVWQAFLAILGLLGSTLAGLFVLGVFFRRSQANGAGALCGAAASVLVLGAVKMWHPVSIFVYAPIGVLSCVAVGLVVSRLTPGASRETPE